MTVQKDPDSDWTNWGVYRHMIHTKQILGGIVNPFQHIGMIYYQRYEARGNAMPFAIFFGGCPTTAIMGSMNPPAGVSEAEVAGGLRRAPLQLVKCETSELLVAATAAAVGWLLAVGALVAVKYFLIDGVLAETFRFTSFVGWDTVWAIAPVVFLTGVLLAMLAAFLTLRKYLRV